MGANGLARGIASFSANEGWHEESADMANHKRRKAKNARCGCLLCKPWKMSGYRTEREGGETFTDHRRRLIAMEGLRIVKAGGETQPVSADPI